MSSESKFLKQVAKNIVRLRKERNMTQEQMAHSMNLDKPHVARFENGTANLTLRSLYRIASVLDVSVEDLIKN